MKKITLLLILFSSIFYSQKKDTITTFSSYGEVEYTMFIKFQSTPIYSAKLNFNENNAVYTYKNLNKEKVIIDNNYHKEEIIPDTIIHEIFSDKKSNKLYSKSIRGYYTYENIPKMNWVLLEETKMFDKIKCNKAKVSFRGRVYIAWYAPSLPSSFGPWKLNGLPGLILEAKDESENVFFKLKKIIIPKKEIVNFINPDFEQKNLMTAIIERDERMKNAMKILNSRKKLRNDDQMKITFPEVIELNYFDLK